MNHNDQRPSTAYRAYLIPVLLILLTTGCTTKITKAPNPIELDSSEFARVYRAAGEVLTDRGYILDQQAYRYGKLTTKPRESGAVVEVWRGDNLTFDQAVESTFNDQRRIVNIMIEPASNESAETTATPDSQSYNMHVEVIIERRRVTTRHLSGSAAGWAIFASYDDVPLEYQQRGITDIYWQPVGRDPLTEQLLIADIIRKSFEIK